jgi:hypothetical protein
VQVVVRIETVALRETREFQAIKRLLSIYQKIMVILISRPKVRIKLMDSRSHSLGE